MTWRAKPRMTVRLCRRAALRPRGATQPRRRGRSLALGRWSGTGGICWSATPRPRASATHRACGSATAHPAQPRRGRPRPGPPHRRGVPRQGVAVGAVLASEWCRTLETAELAFPGLVRAEPAFNSFFEDRGAAAARGRPAPSCWAGQDPARWWSARIRSTSPPQRHPPGLGRGRGSGRRARRWSSPAASPPDATGGAGCAILPTPWPFPPACCCPTPRP